MFEAIMRENFPDKSQTPNKRFRKFKNTKPPNTFPGPSKKTMPKVIIFKLQKAKGK